MMRKRSDAGESMHGLGDRFGVVITWLALAWVMTLTTACGSMRVAYAPAQAGGEARAALARFDEAATGAEIETAITALESAAAAHPEDPRLLSRACSAATLMGAAWSDSRREQGRWYRRAIGTCEAAFATDASYRERIAAGEPAWLAVSVLGDEHMEAMGFWATAVFYTYKDCLRPIGRVLSYRWIGRARSMLERMDEVDPEWEDGAVRMSWGIVYLALPRSVGGDMDKAAEEMSKAIELGPQRMIGRWGRAKYLATLTGNRQLFEDDLRWVLDQDPETAPGPKPWNRHLLADAKTLLASVETYF